MTTARWPLHPVPHRYESLCHWLERVAAAYEVPTSVFCRHAFGREKQEIEALRDDVPMSVLLAIEAGTGITVEQLREMTYGTMLAQIHADLDEMMKHEPEAYADLWDRARQIGRPGN
jgi:hypothetical protein